MIPGSVFVWGSAGNCCLHDDGGILCERCGCTAEDDAETDLKWDSSEFGLFTGAYSFLNVFFLMLMWGGLILDRFGIRFTGKLATILMVLGTGLEYYAMTGMQMLQAQFWDIK